MSYPSSDEDINFYDKTKTRIAETNSDKECIESDMETLSAVIQEEVSDVLNLIVWFKIFKC